MKLTPGEELQRATLDKMDRLTERMESLMLTLDPDKSEGMKVYLEAFKNSIERCNEDILNDCRLRNAWAKIKSFTLYA